MKKMFLSVLLVIVMMVCVIPAVAVITYAEDVAAVLPEINKMYDGFAVELDSGMTGDSFQWYKGEDIIPSATDRVLTLDGNVSDSGAYKCVVTVDGEDTLVTCNVTVRKATGGFTFKVSYDVNVRLDALTDQQIETLQTVGVTSDKVGEYGIRVSNNWSTSGGGRSDDASDFISAGELTVKLGEKQVVGEVVSFPLIISFTDEEGEATQRLRNNYQSLALEQGKVFYMKPEPEVIWADGVLENGITVPYSGSSVKLAGDYLSDAYFTVEDEGSDIQADSSEKEYHYYTKIDIAGKNADEYREQIQNTVSVEFGELQKDLPEFPEGVMAAMLDSELKRVVPLDWVNLDINVTVEYYVKAVYKGNDLYLNTESNEYVRLFIEPAILTYRFKDQLINMGDVVPTLASLGFEQLELICDSALLNNIANNGKLGALQSKLMALANAGKITIDGLPANSDTPGRYNFILSTAEELDSLDPCLSVRFAESTLGIRGPVSIGFREAGVFTLEDADAKYETDGIEKAFVTEYTGMGIPLTVDNIVVNDDYEGTISFEYHDEVDGDDLYSPDNLPFAGDYYVRITASDDGVFSETQAVALISVKPAELLFFPKNQTIEAGGTIDCSADAIGFSGALIENNSEMNAVLQEALPLLVQGGVFSVVLDGEVDTSEAGVHEQCIKIVYDEARLLASEFAYALEYFTINATALGDLTVTAAENPVSDITNVNMTVGNDLSYNVYAKLVAEDADAKMVFTVDGKEMTVEGMFDEGKGLYKYTLAHIPPHGMLVEISAKLMKDGEVLDTHIGTVRGYLETLLLAKPQGMSDEKYAVLKTLIADMLHYGAAAQQYMEYNVETLANAGIDGGSNFEAPAQSIARSTRTGVEGAAIVSVGVRFDYVNKIYYHITTDDISKVKLDVGGNVLGAEDFEQVEEGKYLAYSADISATKFDATVTAILSYDNEKVQTVDYSIASYVFAMHSKTENGDYTALAKLTQRLYAYGGSAVAYVNAQ